MTFISKKKIRWRWTYVKMTLMNWEGEEAVALSLERMKTTRSSCRQSNKSGFLFKSFHGLVIFLSFACEKIVAAFASCWGWVFCRRNELSVCVCMVCGVVLGSEGVMVEVCNGEKQMGRDCGRLLYLCVGEQEKLVDPPRITSVGFLIFFKFCN